MLQRFKGLIGRGSIEPHRVTKPPTSKSRFRIALFPIAIIASLVFAAPAFTKPWKGAEIITRETFKYGAFEARIRGAEGSGMITAFFMWKHDSELAHTEWQEQDFELFGKDGRFQTQVMTPGNPRTENQGYHSLPTPAWENYYTYRMEWTPNYLAFYVDGRLVRRETDPVRYGKLLDPSRAEAAQMRLSLWAGDWSWSGRFDESKVPAAAFVEYAEVYNYTPGAGPNGSDFTSRWRDDFEYINTNRWWFANWTFEFAVNDYIRQNATTIDGKLALILTDNANAGRFPASAPADNPIPQPKPEPEPEPRPPYEPVNVPGRVQAEVVRDNYDTTPTNRHDAICSTGSLDAEITSDAGGGCNVSHTQPGEWTEYEIIAEQAGTYTATLRAATARTNVSMHLKMDGVNVSGPIRVPSAGWQSFTDIPVDVTLVEGSNVFRVYFDTGWANLNYIDFDYLGESDSEPQPQPQPEPEAPPVEDPETGETGYVPVAIPGRVQAEIVSDNYDTTPTNRHDAICSQTDLDSEITLDTGGGCHVSDTRPSEWTEYVIDVPQAGEYNAILRLATARSGITVRMEIEGEDVAGSIAVPRIGWQNFSDVLVPVTLTEGLNTFRIYYETGMANLNYIDFE